VILLREPGRIYERSASRSSLSTGGSGQKTP
jgi:hypothetical protein